MLLKVGVHPAHLAANQAIVRTLAIVKTIVVGKNVSYMNLHDIVSMRYAIHGHGMLQKCIGLLRFKVLLPLDINSHVVYC